MRYLVYQSHTLEELYLETIYSIYSYTLRANEPTVIIIYTDNPDFFQPYLKHLDVRYELINHDTIRKWKGSYNFIHRVKIEMILDVLSKYQGDFLYVDSDTYFEAPVNHVFDNIKKGVRYMHIYEKNLDRSIVYKPLMNLEIEIDGDKMLFNESVQIWNAGAIGFNNSSEPSVKKVLTLTDKLNSHYQKHIIEQFSFSYVFQKEGKIEGLSREIFHYWTLKEFRTYLVEIFQSPLSRDQESLRKIVSAINPAKLTDEKIKWKKKGLARLFQRMFKNKFALAPLPDLSRLVVDVNNKS